MAAPDAPPPPLIMRPTDHDHRTPFDHEAEGRTAPAALAEEFWGDARGWGDRTARRDAPLPSSGDDTTGTIRAIRDGVAAFRPQRVDLRDATGQMRRTRIHGSNRVPAPPSSSDRRAHASIGELAAGDFDEPHDRYDDRFDDVVDTRIDDRYSHRDDDAFGPARYDDPQIVFDDPEDVPLSAAVPRSNRLGVGAVDPLLARFGALALVGVLLVPVALSLRPSEPESNSVLIESPTETDVVGDAAVPADGAGAGSGRTGSDTSDAAASAAPPAATDAGASSDAANGSTAADEQASTGPVSSDTDPATGDDGAKTEREAIGDDTRSTTDDAIGEAATVDALAERVVPECPQTYTAGAGDSWYRIADAAGVTPGVVLSENRATADTVILPGDEICLPADATIPSPPAPPEPAADPEPETTPAPISTASPATTAPPTTTSAPAAPMSVEQVKALIRQTWPAEEHETALRIADRESRFNPRADNNWCCYGIFQIYFEVHRRWLDDFGVYRASDLFDAEKNIAAAHHLYEQAGGWGPWGF